MAFTLFRKAATTEPVFAVYNAIVAQSRQPRFYAQWQVPDTVTGRFDMISLHLALLFRRLRSEGTTARAFSQDVFDLFLTDMDRSLREMGASDLAVPKKMKKMGNLFYGLLASVDDALATNNVETVADVLVRNVLDDAAVTGARDLAGYLVASSHWLAGQPAEAIIGGTIALEPTA